MAKICGVIFLAVAIQTVRCTTSLPCIRKSSCVCALSDYSKIDLSDLFDVTPEKDPKIRDKLFLVDSADSTDSANNVTRVTHVAFYFHGCTDGDWIAKEHHAQVNQTNQKASLIRVNDDKVNFSLPSSQIEFHAAIDNPGAYDIIYTNGTDVYATIRLLCDNYNMPFIKIDDNNISANKLILSSPHACIITHHPGLSTGSVLVIIFVVVVALYLVVGALIAYFIRGARGLELIPNIDFWRGLPGLVKDGLIFLFSGCNATAVSTPDSYDRI